MNNALIPIKSAADFRLASLFDTDRELTRAQRAAKELIECVDIAWKDVPPVLKDFFLRFLRSNGIPIDYPPLPVWAERAAHHFFTICYPTLRKRNLNKPSPEDFGRAAGHMLAMVAQAKEDGKIFQRLPEKTTKEIKAFLAKIDAPLRILIDDGLHLPGDEAGAFLRGLNHAFHRTFDATGWPIGWNTNSPVLIGICLGWRLITTESPSLPFLHKALVKAIGESLIGSEEHVKKICQRIGLRFSGNRAIDREGTAVILDVPSAVQTKSDK
jgi:hypothetical protein